MFRTPGCKNQFCSRSGLLFGLLFAFVSASANANGFLDGSLASGWEDNITRGFSGSDQHNSPFLGVSLSGGKLYQLRTNTSLVLAGSASYHTFSSVQGLNRFNLTADVSLQQKFGLGPYSPRLSLGASIGRDELKGGERDRYLYAVELGFSKRLNQSWNVNFGASRETSRGFNERDVNFSSLPNATGATRPTDPMDYYNNIFFGSLDYEFASGWLLTGSHQTIDGYIVPSAVPPVASLFKHAKALAIDPAFSRLQVLYLLKSRSSVWGTNLSVPLGADSAVDFAYSWQDIDADHVGSYQNFQFSINLIHRF
ncbi:MAG: hypothetical protein WD772_02205 [Pseudohongiellaceae bacterium]